jgi:hypothetical protein
MKKITATLAAVLLLGVAGNALAAYSAEETVTPAQGIITVIGPVDSLDSRGIITVIEPLNGLETGGIVTVIEPALNGGIVSVVEPMDFTFTQLAYSEGFFFDTADTFGSGGSRMATISATTRIMGRFLPSPPNLVTVVEPSSSGIITVIEPADATTVPVPPALFLMGSGLAGLAGIRRKRQS